MDLEVMTSALSAVLDGPVTGLRRLSGGASRETWSLECDGRPLILQRERAGGGMTSNRPMTLEASLLRAARAAGVPVPEVVAAGGDGDGLGAGYVIAERLDGEAIPRKLLRDDEFADARPKLTAQWGTALAAIHRVPTEGFEALDQPDQLDQFRGIWDSFGEPSPAFELAFRWLTRNRPPAGPHRLVHGDFRLGNVLVDASGLVAVLDWELAHLGDPIEDLGWLCVRAWRFGAPGRVGGMGSVDELLAAYESAGGAPVDPEVLRWWEMLGTLKWGIMCRIQAASHLGGFSRSVELATIGRRVVENEHDLLELLPPPSPRAGSAGSADPTPAGDAASLADRQPHDLYGRPTAAELVEAVREFLEGDVMSSTTGRTQFHARVAVNALRMVERELADGASHRADHAARLSALGFASDADLAAAIRDGSLDDRWAEVRAAVAASVTDKLSVSNPSYA